MLDETLSECLYQVEIVDATTLPATFENSNEYILELYELKRSLVLKESTMRAYMGVARKLVRFSGSTCRQYIRGSGSGKSAPFYLLTENMQKQIIFRGLISGDLNIASNNKIPSGIYYY